MYIDMLVRCVLFHHSFYILPFGDNNISDPLFHNENTSLFCRCFLMGFGVILNLFTGAGSQFLFCSSAASMVAVSKATHISSAVFNVSLSMDSIAT